MTANSTMIYLHRLRRFGPNQCVQAKFFFSHRNAPKEDFCCFWWKNGKFWRLDRISCVYVVCCVQGSSNHRQDLAEEPFSPFLFHFLFIFLSPHFFRLRNKNMISREVSKNYSFKNNLGYEIYSRKVSMKHWCLSLNLYGNWSHAQKLLLLKKAVFFYGYSKLKI